MKQVNKHFLNYIITPLIGSADDDEMVDQYSDLDPNNESAVKAVLDQTVKADFFSRSENFIAQSKLALSYYLTTDKIDFGLFFNSLLIAFDHPDNPKDFFVWVWQVLFGEEKYVLKDWKEYTKYDNWEEPLYMK